MIANPTVEQLTDENINKYELVRATAKIAERITNEYVKQRNVAERKLNSKEIDGLSNVIDKSLREENAVTRAVDLYVEGKYKIVKKERKKQQ